MIRLFTGFDEREAVGWHVFCQSVLETASAPVQIVPITTRMADGLGLGAAAGGTNAFTRARFLVPHLCGYKGWAIFADGVDMLCRGDLAGLWAFKDRKEALGEARKELWCVKHAYTSRFPRKYEGTAMEADNQAYERKNWASLFLVNCASPFARLWHPDLVARRPLLELLQFAGFDEARIGALPAEWNWLIGEYEHNDAARLAHYTLGIPGFARYRDAGFAAEWRGALERAQQGLQAAAAGQG